MENIDAIFHETLKFFVRKERSYAAFAERVGISLAYLNDILYERRHGGEKLRRQIAYALGYRGAAYEDFLDVGRAIVLGRDPDLSVGKWTGMTGDDLKDGGFIKVPFSDNMFIPPESVAKFIPVTDEEDDSKIIFHGSIIGRLSSRNLQAFRVDTDSMEPFISVGGTVLVDISENTPESIIEGKMYVTCLDLQDGSCVVKFLAWAEKDVSLVFSSPDVIKHPPLVRKLLDIVIIGRVILSWRPH